MCIYQTGDKKKDSPWLHSMQLWKESEFGRFADFETKTDKMVIFYTYAKKSNILFLAYNNRMFFVEIANCSLYLSQTVIKFFGEIKLWLTIDRLLPLPCLAC